MKKHLYDHLYTPIVLGSESMPDVPVAGKTVADQARKLDYQDIYRDIQAMRDAEFKKEEKEGEVTPEFKGWFGEEVAKKALPTGLIIAAVLAYLFLFKKKKEVVAPAPVSRKKKRRKRH